MWGLLLVLSATSGAAPQEAGAPPIRFHDVVHVRSAPVALGELADLRAVPVFLRGQAAALAIMALPAGHETVTVRVADVEARVRALMPILAPLLGAHTNETLMISTGREEAEPLWQVQHTSERNVSERATQAQVAKGDTAAFVVHAGVVDVERRAVALQAGVNGQKLFVKTQDGDILAVRCCTVQ